MSTRISSPSFIGRRAELEQARAALVRAAGGEPGPILVSGEAGIGKSRLLGELAEWATERGYRVLTGGCVSLSAEVAPFAPIVQALRPLAHTLPPPELEAVLGPSRRALAPLLPELIPVGFASGATGISQDGSRERLLEQFLGLLHRLGTISPVLLVLEDVHWADASTIDVMTFLARNLEADPIQLVTSFRTDEPHAGRTLTPFIAEIGRHARAVRMDLQPFNRVELAEQIGGILGAPATSTVVEELLHRSQGNAFFVEELIAAGGLPGVLPESLQDVLRARVNALSPETAELVRVASATGRRFSEDLLAAVAGSDDARFRGALREAIEQQILVPDRGGDREVLRFRHALVQEILHGDLLPRERERLHAACARVLEEGPGAADDPALASELAHHWHAAAQPERALQASVVAGLAAETAGAPAEAAAQFERAVELLEQLPDVPSRSGPDAVQVREHAAANLLADPARAVSHIRDALALVDPQREPIRAGLLTAALGRYLWFSGDGAAALAAAREAVRLVPPEPPTVELARVTAGLGQILMILAHPDEGMVVAEEAVRLARLTGAELIESHALSTLGLLTAYAGNVEAGLEMQRRALQIAVERESLDDVGRAYTNLYDTLMVAAARFDDAEEVALEAVGRSDGLQVGGVWAAAAWRDIAWARYLTGRWDEAVEALERARRHAASGVGDIEWAMRAAQVHVGRGDFEVASPILGRLSEQLANAADTQWIAPAAAAAAELALWRGDPSEALSVIAVALRRIQPSAGANVSRIGPLLALGLRAAADVVEDTPKRGRGSDVAGAAAKAGADHLAMIRRVHEDLEAHAPAHRRLSGPWLAVCEAESTRLAGNPDPTPWRRAANLFTDLPIPYWAAYARYREAEALLAVRQGKADAREALIDAHSTGRRLGAAPLLAAIEAVAQRGRLELDGPEPGRGRSVGPAGLTARELEVVPLLAAGMTNRQIGERLFITEKTASHHVSTILSKLGVSRRGEVGSAATRLGVRAPPE